MRIACLLSLCAVALVACDNFDPYLPDGGRARPVCSQDAVSVPVKVFDPLGAPAPGVTVRGTNAGDGRYAEGTTDGRGVYIIKQELGPGVVTVTSDLNGLTATPSDFTFTCSAECTCAAFPREILLHLK